MPPPSPTRLTTIQATTTHFKYNYATPVAYNAYNSYASPIAYSAAAAPIAYSGYNYPSAYSVYSSPAVASYSAYQYNPKTENHGYAVTY
jgi:hypothetical protein